jgi:uncharacterized membrane protein (DUF4010 family)
MLSDHSQLLLIFMHAIYYMLYIYIPYIVSVTGLGLTVLNCSFVQSTRVIVQFVDFFVSTHTETQ